MDKLTLLSLATHQPRRAVRFGNPNNKHECAQCCVTVNWAMERVGTSFTWEGTHKVDEPLDGVLDCRGCGLPLEYHDAT